MSWTEDRIGLLKKLWTEGKTAAEIAGVLGGITRNAVIGKAHRLKLSQRASPLQQNVKKTSAVSERALAAPKLRAPVQENATKKILERDKSRPRVSMMALNSRSCRWPIGDPRDGDFGFCGCPIDTPGLSYCPEHMRVAYQPAGRSRQLQAEDFERPAPAVSTEDEDFMKVSTGTTRR